MHAEAWQRSMSFGNHVQELLVSPYLLLQNNIPVVRCTQYPGEFIINYPGRACILLARHLILA